MINSEEIENSRADFEALMDFMLGFMRVVDPGFEQELFGMLRTWVYYRPGMLQYEHKMADKAFFVAKGLVFAFFYNLDQEIVAFRIFKKGEIALIPESFISGQVAGYSLMVCADSRLMEISASQMGYVYEAFPQAVMLALKIVAGLFDKDVQKDKMLSLGKLESIRRFYELYPDLYGNTGMQFFDMYIARHLNMSPITFSRLRKELFPSYPED